MKSLLPILFAGALTMAGPALAADPHAGHGAKAPSAAATARMSEGTVRKVDAAAGRITLAHGPLENLGMPAMTMVFKVRDPALLKGVQVGDAVQFVAEQAGNDYVVVRLQPKR